MRKVREILRRKHELGLSHREVAEGLGVSVGVVSKVVNRCTLSGMTWSEVAGMAEDEVEARLFGRGKPGKRERPKADPVWIHTELKKARGDTGASPPRVSAGAPGWVPVHTVLRAL